uniref:FKBP8 isomerase n=1 Tax=Junco hyemalis TaxID=40217 RepID=A0A8C5IAN5_JUNHY
DGRYRGESSRECQFRDSRLGSQRLLPRRGPAAAEARGAGRAGRAAAVAGPGGVGEGAGRLGGRRAGGEGPAAHLRAGSRGRRAGEPEPVRGSVPCWLSAALGSDPPAPPCPPTGSGAGRPHHAARGGFLLPRRFPLRLRPPGQVGRGNEQARTGARRGREGRRTRAGGQEGQAGTGGAEPVGRAEQGTGAGRAGVAGSRRCISREPDVPPEAPLLFEVTLLEVRDSPDPQPLPPAVRLRLGSQRRERGNFHFARGDFAAALRSYRLSLRALDGPTAAPPGPEEEEELREQRVKCLNNCAAAELKLGRAEEALAACETALRICPDNGRALLRRGQLLAEQGRDAEAALVLKRALELDPASKVIHTELSRLAKRQSPPSITGPQNPRHDPMPPPSPAAPAPPSAKGAI